METLLTHKIVSMTELREPSKVLNQANNQPVAIMNRNQVVGYFVPVAAVQSLNFTPANSDEVKKTLSEIKPFISKVLKYLEDK